MICEMDSQKVGTIIPPQRMVDRASWGRSIEFVLSLLGYAIGLSNVLRFPYMCMKNGGGAFLIPYFCCVFLCAMPLLFLEMIMGQYLRTGCLSCWDTYSPVLKGVGFGVVSVSAACTVLYQTTYAWILYFLYQSFTWNLPWTTCNATWNTPACVSTYDYDQYTTGNSSTFTHMMNQTTGEDKLVNLNETNTYVSAAEQFFHHDVLEISSGIHDLNGGLKGHLLISTLICWVGFYFCIIKGAKSVGKVIYVTATAPYVFITIFIIRAALLPGSLDGVRYYITPNFQRLTEPQIWLQAFIQVFFSMGPGWGGIITMASYNKFHHKFYREAVAVPIVSCTTSLLCGFLVFSVAGFLAEKTGRTVAEAISSGPGLAFVTYPEAAAHMPAAPVWAILFFLMLIMTGADSHFVTIETCISAINDELRLKKRYRVCFITGVITVLLLSNLIFMTGAGMYLFQAVDWYIGPPAFLFALLECVAMVWLYGYQRLFQNVEDMIGRIRFHYFFVALWGIVIPLLLVVCAIYYIAKMTPPTYGDYVYPDWVPYLGHVFYISFAVPIPIVALYRFWQTHAPTLSERLRLTCFGDTNVDKAEENSVSETFL